MTVLLRRQVDPTIYRVPGGPALPDVVEVLGVERIGRTDLNNPLTLDTGKRVFMSFGVFHIVYRDVEGGQALRLPLHTFGEYYGGARIDVNVTVGGTRLPLRISSFMSKVPR